MSDMGRSVDDPLAIAACVALGVVGLATFMGMPMVVGAVIDQYGYSEGQGGYLASSEYLGMFAASALVSLLILRVSRRKLALAGTLTAIVSNALSTAVSALPTLLALRFITGLGCGAAYAIAAAVLAGSQQTVRNFMFLIFAQVLTNALVMYLFPSLVANWHVAGIFLAYCGMLMLAGVFIPYLPKHFAFARTSSSRSRSEHGAVAGWVPWLCLAAVFCFYLMVGAYWAYIERIGIAVGFDTVFVGQITAAGILLSLIACLVAYRLSERIGQSRPLLLALGLVATTHIWSGLWFGPGPFLVGFAVVNCFWNFTDIYQLGTISNIDRTGVFASRVQGAQMLAMTISSASAGFLLDRGIGYPLLLVILGVYVAIAFAAYFIAYATLHRRSPLLADAA